eukprot:TRINITY_DN7330_c0_g2_i1.p1 TRINITY_DN7330_c0_g2~~TRINITY_DN7330_c0_g2_i1.p1  ORF type:complete len:892 (+),score=86.59 TRINITY_DN7330_c0_g2_i1:171-2846(+)
MQQPHDSPRPVSNAAAAIAALLSSQLRGDQCSSSIPKSHVFDHGQHASEEPISLRGIRLPAQTHTRDDVSLKYNQGGTLRGEDSTRLLLDYANPEANPGMDSDSDSDSGSVSDSDSDSSSESMGSIRSPLSADFTKMDHIEQNPMLHNHVIEQPISSGQKSIPFVASSAENKSTRHTSFLNSNTHLEVIEQSKENPSMIPALHSIESQHGEDLGIVDDRHNMTPLLQKESRVQFMEENDCDKEKSRHVPRIDNSDKCLVCCSWDAEQKHHCPVCLNRSDMQRNRSLGNLYQLETNKLPSQSKYMVQSKESGTSPRLQKAVSHGNLSALAKIHQLSSVWNEALRSKLETDEQKSPDRDQSQSCIPPNYNKDRGTLVDTIGSKHTKEVMKTRHEPMDTLNQDVASAPAIENDPETGSTQSMAPEVFERIRPYSVVLSDPSTWNRDMLVIWCMKAQKLLPRQQNENLLRETILETPNKTGIDPAILAKTVSCPGNISSLVDANASMTSFASSGKQIGPGKSYPGAPIQENGSIPVMVDSPNQLRRIGSHNVPSGWLVDTHTGDGAQITQYPKDSRLPREASNSNLSTKHTVSTGGQSFSQKTQYDAFSFNMQGSNGQRIPNHYSSIRDQSPGFPLQNQIQESLQPLPISKAQQVMGLQYRTSTRTPRAGSIMAKLSSLMEDTDVNFKRTSSAPLGLGSGPPSKKQQTNVYPEQGGTLGSSNGLSLTNTNPSRKMSKATNCLDSNMEFAKESSQQWNKSLESPSGTRPQKQVVAVFHKASEIDLLGGQPNPLPRPLAIAPGALSMNTKHGSNTQEKIPPKGHRMNSTFESYDGSSNTVVCSTCKGIPTPFSKLLGQGHVICAACLHHWKTVNDGCALCTTISGLMTYSTEARLAS